MSPGERWDFPGRRFTNSSRRFVVPLTTSIHDLGLQLAERYGFPVYDAMIVAAAITNDCDVLYSEDFQNGLNVGELSIVNPLN